MPSNSCHWIGQGLLLQVSRLASMSTAARLAPRGVSRVNLVMGCVNPVARRADSGFGSGWTHWLSVSSRSSLEANSKTAGQPLPGLFTHAGVSAANC